MSLQQNVRLIKSSAQIAFQDESTWNYRRICFGAVNAVEKAYGVNAGGSGKPIVTKTLPE
jgi:hypothetical protein